MIEPTFFLILHAFQKRSKKGIVTSKQDVNLIKKRYKEALEIEKNDSKIEFERSTGNVYADLELKEAEELQIRALIGFHIVELLKREDVKQIEIAELLHIKQAEVSHLFNGHFSRFTVDKLLDFLKRMNQKVVIQISPHKQGEPFQYVASGITENYAGFQGS